jgi:hypothetical protein
MTNERVHAISPDGVLTWAEPAPPGEFMVIPKGASPEDEARMQREYQQSGWRTQRPSLPPASTSTMARN